MRKSFWILLLSFCFFLNSFSQDIKQNVIASAGGIDKTGAISFEWTLGEFAVETLTATKNIYTQGFHQPILIVKSFHSPPKSEFSNVILSSYKVALTPNPAKSFVNVYISSIENEKYSIALYDINGKRVTSRYVSGSDLSFHIEMGHLASGVYLMSVQNNTGTMRRSFKIIKAE